MPLYVVVYLDQNLQRPLDYSVPSELVSQVAVGMRVEVPLKSKTVKGTIAALKKTSPFSSVRSILKIISMRSELSVQQWKLAEWMSHYYATTMQKVLRCFIPPNVRNETKEKTKIFLTLAKSHEKTLLGCQTLRTKAPKQAEALELILKYPKGVFLSDLGKTISRGSIQTLIEKKWILSRQIVASSESELEDEFFQTVPKILNQEQESALKSIESSLIKDAFSSHLIHGVTGSGKTEVYLQAIAKTLELNKSVILLVPEIALTSQTIERFRARFSEKLAVLHHKRSLGERSSSWEDLRSGKIRIAIGARSAIFCPIQNLGLIIVDEEHDGSYKQTDEMPCYQARDISVMRAHFEECTVVLGSATPSIESMYNAEVGKYVLHSLSKRATKANLSKVHVIDMKQALDKNGGFTHFSSELLEAIKERVEKGEQTLLLLNKRGYHRMQLCLECRSPIKCPHCDISLTFHKQENTLKCHMCNFFLPPARNCPNCNAKSSLEFKGFGTEHVERSLKAIFPSVRTLRMDRDTTKKKDSHEILFKQFRSHKADVLIGTQMIAKGFHFPSVTLVGVLNLDASLTIPDFRSPENVFQLLIQVAGRAGREELPGEVFLQTFMPDHPIISLAKRQDYNAFYQREIEERKAFGSPPFSRFCKLVISSKEKTKAHQTAVDLCEALKKEVLCKVFPVTPSGHAKIKGLYRFQFLIKAKSIAQISSNLKKIPPSNSIKIDVDPLSTFF